MAAMSGVKCQQDVIDKYNIFKKSGSNIAYIICKIEDGKIVIDEAPEYEGEERGQLDEKKIPVTYNRLVDALIKGLCRYAFYTFEWTTPGGPRDCIVLIQYCDDNASAKIKMPYSTSTNAIRKPCAGVGLVIEANDKDEIGYGEILEKAKKTKR